MFKTINKSLSLAIAIMMIFTSIVPGFAFGYDTVGAESNPTPDVLSKENGAVSGINGLSTSGSGINGTTGGSGTTSGSGITGIAVKTPPDKTIYMSGEKLKLDGLIVTLQSIEGEEEEIEVAFEDFDSNGIVTDPENNTILTTEHSTVTISHVDSGKSVQQSITVMPAPEGIGLPDGLYTADVYGWHGANDNMSMMGSSMDKRAWLKVENGVGELTIRFIRANIMGLEIDGTAIAQIIDNPTEEQFSSALAYGLSATEAVLHGVSGTDNPDKSRAFKLQITRPVNEYGTTYIPVVYNVVFMGMVTAGRVKMENITKVSDTPEKVTAIELVNPPSKTSYIDKEPLDYSGMKIRLIKENGSEEIITLEKHGKGVTDPTQYNLTTWPAGGSLVTQAVATTGIFSVSYANPDGRATAPVSFGKDDGFQLEVLNSSQSNNIKNLEIEQMPARTVYAVGETLNTTLLNGLKVTVTYTDDTTATFTQSTLGTPGLVLEPAINTKLTEEHMNLQKIVVKHPGSNVTVSFDVTITDKTGDMDLIDMVVEGGPRIFSVGETVNASLLNGLVVKLNYPDGYQKTFTRSQLESGGLTIDPAFNTVFTADDIGPVEFTISHTASGKEVKFTAEVKEKSKVIKSMTVATPPDKTVFFTDEKLDWSGLKVNITYHDGNVDEGVKLEDFNDYGLYTDPAQGTDAVTSVSNGWVYIAVNGRANLGRVSTGYAVGRHDLESLRLINTPAKRVYEAGDTVSLTNLQLETTYSDGSHDPYALNENSIVTYFDVYPSKGTILDASHVGLKELKFTHKGTGIAISYPIIVVQSLANTADVQKISIASMPTVAAVAAGGTITDGHMTGLKIKVTYAGGLEETYDYSQFAKAGLSVEQIGNNAPVNTGKHTLTVKHAGSGKTTDFEISIVGGDAVKSLAIKKQPKTAYDEGDTLDLSGLILDLTLYDGNTVSATYAEFEGYGLEVNLNHGTQLGTASGSGWYGIHLVTIRSKYSGVQTTFNFTVYRTDLELSVKTMPARTTLNVGETLSKTTLAGLVTSMIYSEGYYGAGTIVNLEWTPSYDHYSANGMIFEPELGTILTAADVGNKTITIKNPTGSKSTSFTITVEQAQEPTYEISVIAGANGTVNTTGGTYEAGEEIEIEATPAQGYKFTGWTVTGAGTVADAASASTTFTVGAGAGTVTAGFEQESIDDKIADGIYTIGIAAWKESGDTLSNMASALAPQAALKIENEKITATIKFVPTTIMTLPVTGADIKEVWAEPEGTLELGTGTAGIVNEEENSKTFTFELSTLELPKLSMTVTPMDNAIMTIRLKFDMDTLTEIIEPEHIYEVTVVAGANGTVNTTGGTYNKGEEIEITATPAEGYKFAGWTVTGEGAVADAAKANTIFTVGEGEATVTASFEIKPVNSDGIADGNYEIDVYGWKEDSDSASMMKDALNKTAQLKVEDGKYTVRIKFIEANIMGLNITGETVKEVWPEPEQPITNDDKGTGLNGIVNQEEGSKTYTFSLKSLDYPKLSVHIGAPMDVVQTLRLKFDMDTLEEADESISTYEITVASGANGTVEAITGTYPEGYSIDIKATPDEGYVFKEWTLEGAGTLENSEKAETKFTVGNGGATVTAVFTEKEAEKEYNISFVKGIGVVKYEGAGKFKGGQIINISATLSPNYELVSWKSNQEGGTFGDPYSLTTTYTLPEMLSSSAISLAVTVKKVQPILNLADGEYIVSMKALKEANDEDSVLNGLLSQTAEITVEDGIIKAKIKVIDGAVQPPIPMFPPQPASGADVTEAWLGKQASEVEAGTGNKGVFNESDKSRIFEFELTDLVDPYLSILVKPMDNAIMTARLNFDWDNIKKINEDGNMADGIYTIAVAALHETNDVPSAMASALDPQATLRIENEKITATIKFIKTTIMGQAIDGNAISEVWPEPAIVEEFPMGSGYGGIYNEADGSKTFTFKVSTLDKPKLSTRVVPLNNAIQTIRLNFDKAALSKISDLPTDEPNLEKPVELPAEIVQPSEKDNVVTLDKEALKTWIDGMDDEEKKTMAVAIPVQKGTEGSADGTVIIPVTVLESHIGDGVESLQIVIEKVSGGDEQGVEAALPQNTTVVQGFDVKLIKVMNDGETEEVHNLNGKVKVIIILTPDQISELSEGTQRLFYYNPVTKALNNMNATFGDNTAAFYTEHFSAYVITVTKTGDNGNIPVPNPGLDPDNLEDGRYTIRAEAFKEKSNSYSMAHGLIVQPLQLDVEGGKIWVSMLLRSTGEYPLEEVKMLLYMDKSGSYKKANLTYNSSSQTIVLEFPTNSITEEQYMQVDVPIITDDIGVQTFRLVFDTDTLKKGGSMKDPSSIPPVVVNEFVIKASAGVGGTITPSGDVKVEKGKDQKFVIKADEGYKIKYVIVDGKSVGAVETYTFKNVQKGATISVSFEKVDGANSSVVFTDTAGHWAENVIKIVVEKGLLLGTGDNKFSPDLEVTRGMLVTILGRLANADVSSYESSKFADVDFEQYYAKSIAWAAEAGIVAGVADDRFAPDTAITREQLAVIFMNYTKFAEIDLEKTTDEITDFADVNEISSWAKSSVLDAQKAGLINGKENNRFDPKGTATRAEVAAIVVRLLDIVEAQQN